MNSVLWKPVREHLRKTAPDLLFAIGAAPGGTRIALGAAWAVVHQLLQVLQPAPPSEDGGCCEGESIERRVAVCESILDHLDRGEPTGRPELDAFKTASEQLHLSRTAISNMVAARVEAMSLRRFATWPRLRHTARATVEPLMAGLLHGDGFTELKREQATAWATSLWLTWELSDLPAQVRAGRLILPLDDLVRFEVREADVAGFVDRGTTGGDARWAALMAHHAERLKLLNHGGSACLPLMRDDLGRCAAALGALTMARLDRLTRLGGDVFAHGLPTLSLWDRMTCLPRIRRTLRAATRKH